MQPGSAEDGNDRVANELLYRSAVVLDNGAHPAEVGRLHVLKCLRVEILPDGGGSDEIAKEGRNRPPLGALHRHILVGPSTHRIIAPGPLADPASAGERSVLSSCGEACLAGLTK